MIFGYFYAFLAWKIIFNFILSKLYIEFAPFGPVAQLVEHHLDMVVVDGSNPFGATINLGSLFFFGWLSFLALFYAHSLRSPVPYKRHFRRFPAAYALKNSAKIRLNATATAPHG